MTTSEVSASKQGESHQEISAEGGFVYPELYHFPPFFTKQLAPQTWESQQSAWHELILSYCKYHKKYRLAVSYDIVDSEPFHNPRIQRKLKYNTFREIIDQLISAGQAEWVDPQQKAELLIYWHKPAEWASLISQYVASTGQQNTVFTFYELTESNAVRSTELYELDPMIARKAVGILVKQSQAQTIKGPDGDIAGFKFFVSR